MAERYADVVVDITDASLDKSYQYRIPDSLQAKAAVGSVVRVPFGGGRRVVEGYIIQISDQPKIDPTRIKRIAEICTDRMEIESELIRLAVWMRNTYGGGLNNALKTVLPVRNKEKEPRDEKIRLAVSREMAEQLILECEVRHYKAKERLLRALLEQGELNRSYITGTLKITAGSLRNMQEKGIVSSESYTAWRDPPDLREETESVSFDLTGEQQTAVRQILLEWKTDNRPILIHGVTGSGKTAVYMELMERVLAENRQVIVLIPEIALTWQNVRRFRQRFGDKVTILNSKMSRGERADQYEKMKRGEAQIVIGPRSALFTPFSNLGLIIIDEEQESSYRSESTPRYDAREAALFRAEAEGAHVVFGSATPSVDSYYRAKSGTYALTTLKERYGNAQLPEVRTVDLRDELKNGNRSIISRELREEIEKRLACGEQSILFLNRRGFSGFVSCRSCGEVIKCPHCDVSLTYHTNGKLVCHYCGYEQDQVSACPKCGSPYISGFRAGTERVQVEVQKYFPQAKVLRMDADTTRKKDGHEKILKAFADHEADILIGTQMIVKGHDFPDVTLVGILAADLSLFSSDYRAPERTFQLLVQACGRAGRGDKPGLALIQSYSPDHFAIQASLQQDYETFYEEEITGRDMMEYPPYAHMLAIHASSMDEGRLDTAMTALRRFLARYEYSGVSVIGPAPEPVVKIKDSYRMVLFIKCADYERIVKIRNTAEKYIDINKGFNRIQFQYDLDA